MDSIKIGTLNCQNSKINRNGGLNGEIDNVSILADHIVNTGYYFLGTQELTRVFSRKLLDNISNYKMYGNYRYGDCVVNNIKFISDFNENNNIITNQKVVGIVNKKLPWIPNNAKDMMKALIKASIMPRIATGIHIEDENFGKIFAINTHLDYQIPSVQQRQLNNLLRMIKTISKECQAVLTGDLNMEISNPLLKDFSDQLHDIGLKRVQINSQTHLSKATPIDHIFIPSSWNILNAGIIEDKSLETITDHKGIVAEVLPKQR